MGRFYDYSPLLLVNTSEMKGKGGTITAEEVERSLDGNICRCTGYRPIMDAFKAFAVDGPPNFKDRLLDIEVQYTKRNF